MKKQPFILLITILFTASFSACKKDKNETQVTLDAQFKQFNTDASSIKSESDQADNDINNSLSEIPGMGRLRNDSLNSIFSSPLCGVNIDSSQVANKIIFFNFDGQTPCFSPSRTRAGQIKVQLTGGQRWSDQGAILTLTYTNFKIVRLSDNKSIMFNGTKTLKNLNGNDWMGFLAGTANLRYQERALNVNVTLDNNQSAVWNSARITTWSYVPQGQNSSIPYAYISFSATGDTIVNGHANVDSWGVNRYGYNFTTYYNSTITSNTYCGLWRFNSGQLVHTVNNADYTLTLGVDQNGNATPYACAYGFKVGWTANGNPQSVILSY